jgi:TRAP-type transport system large permease protein
MTSIIAIFFFGFLALGMPIAFVLGVTGMIAILKLGTPGLLELIPIKVYNGIDIFPLMAMPLFILAGDIMNRTGITGQLVNLALRLVGHMRGGLAHANIVAEIFFSGITGSAVADAAALGTLLVPAMEKQGFPKNFSAALVAAAATLGPIIPPSTVMVIYGSIMGVSIAGLFAAGLIPGILMAGALMLCVNRMAVKGNYPKGERRASILEIIRSFKQAILALLMPAIILGGILAGIFTPTEAAAVSVFCALIIGFLIYRNLKLKDLWNALTEMTLVTAVVFIILSTAAIFSWLLASEQIPQKVANLILTLTTNKVLVLLIINFILLIVGCFMDQTAALIILAPVLAPLAYKVGVHPLHFGMIMILNLVIGLITPPLGACLFTVCSIGRMPLEAVIKPILPLTLALIAVLMLITYIPAITLTIPKLFGFI